MRYKCIKDYRKKGSDTAVLVFTKGITYLEEQVINRVPMPIIPEYFKEMENNQDLGYEPESESMVKDEPENMTENKPQSLFNTLLDQIKDTHERKNHDYGNSFAKSMDEFGMSAAAIRLTDKLSRFKSLIKSEAQVKDESIEDTLLDMATYAIMTVEYLKERKL